MAKVSIGLRGWRFDEDDVFSDGEFRPLDEMPEDARHRLLRLNNLVEEPCDACYLLHGEENEQRCRPAEIVYGEPFDELVLCLDHEADFLYWFREAGGSDLRGTAEFAEAFHQWFLDGGRAPEGYEGLNHVETDPTSLPELPDAEAIHERLNENFEGRRIDIRNGVVEENGERRVVLDDGASESEDDAEAEDDEDETGDLDLDGVDLGTDYPTR